MTPSFFRDILSKGGVFVINTTFGELYSMDFNLDSFFAMHQYWKGEFTNMTNTPRPTCAFLYSDNCELLYTFKNSPPIRVGNKKIVYIPKGATYKTEFISLDGDDSHTMLIEFTITSREGEPISMGTYPSEIISDTSGIYKTMFVEMIDSYNMPTMSPSVIKSILYRLVSQISKEYRQQNVYSNTYRSIAKGINYFETQMKQDMSIADVAKMCHVSESSFRRIFKQYMGVTPVEFRNTYRIEHAKRMLETSVLSIREIAEILGIDDIPYFHRIFKKSVGMTPREYKSSKLSNQ